MEQEIQTDKLTLQQKLQKLQKTRAREKVAGTLAILLTPLGIIFGIVGFLPGFFAAMQDRLGESDSGGAFLFLFGFLMFVFGIISGIVWWITASKRAKLEQKFESIDVYSQATVPELIEALSYWDPVVRKKAARALGRLGPGAKDAVQALIKMLKDDDEYFDVSYSVAWALGEIGDESAIPVLRDTMNDEGVEDDIRDKAAKALKNIEGKA